MPPLTVPDRSAMFESRRDEELMAECQRDLREIATRSGQTYAGELRAKACQVYRKATDVVGDNFKIVKDVEFKADPYTGQAVFVPYFRVVKSTTEESRPTFDERDATWVAADLNEISGKEFLAVEIEANWFSPDVWTVVEKPDDR